VFGDGKVQADVAGHGEGVVAEVAFRTERLAAKLSVVEPFVDALCEWGRGHHTGAVRCNPERVLLRRAVEYGERLAGGVGVNGVYLPAFRSLTGDTSK